MHDARMDDLIDVKSLRERFGWTQDQMALELGCDRSTVSRMEAGQEPSGATKILLRQLAQRAFPEMVGGTASHVHSPGETGDAS